MVERTQPPSESTNNDLFSETRKREAKAKENENRVEFDYVANRATKSVLSPSL